MNRGIKDEGFIRRALDMATSEDGRWIAKQDYFNSRDNDPLSPKVHAALVTATSIYVEKMGLNEELITEAINAKTCGQARAFIDKYNELTFK